MIFRIVTKFEVLTFCIHLCRNSVTINYLELIVRSTESIYVLYFLIIYYQPKFLLLYLLVRLSWVWKKNRSLLRFSAEKISMWSIVFASTLMNLPNFSNKEFWKVVKMKSIMDMYKWDFIIIVGIWKYICVQCKSVIPVVLYRWK